MSPLHPLLILALGIAVVIGLITVVRMNAFIALITAAIVVSLLSPGETPLKIKRVAEAFGTNCGNIGIVIALAAIIGKCMMDSGAADRIVRTFLWLLGKEKASFALMGSGFVLAIPVFFDTVFYLLVPLARSLYRQTGKNYLLYLLAIAAGGAITHTLVPPTPGPLLMAENLKVDIGTMIMVGTLIAFPSALVGILFATIADRVAPIAMRQIGSEPDPEPLPDSQLPSLAVAILPVILPVLLISADTIATTISKMAATGPFWERAVLLAKAATPYTAIIGNANLALLIATAIALLLVVIQRKPSLNQLAHIVEVSLMSGGTIILITAAGGAFGAMLREAQIGPAIKNLMGGQESAMSGILYLFLGYLIAVIMKVAQGSSTVAMITASGMIAAMLSPAGSEPVAFQTILGFHPVYLATAIGSGTLVGSWMNDSGFWIFAKMGGLTEVETLRSWTPLLAVLGITGFVVTLICMIIMPLS
ncbi:Gnt-II system L-idonate transporter [Anatilimnocola aggregata]|uniref:Gnt-II system L-idonate transporter n=1 Tax=Anatilimnocola aggregata TaxID=2528021 RepID=A0A517YGS9_9BACT|nr:SLC13 family permease [Anatilimnocola aggregata]QDU29419.1 Gnt-II system L-idonate transporter [Anatilimnocola aggregata]